VANSYEVDFEKVRFIIKIEVSVLLAGAKRMCFTKEKIYGDVLLS
jgi:hypothetical protein